MFIESSLSRPISGCRLLLVSVAICLLATLPAESSAQEPAGSLRARLEQRVSERPGDAASWRMLGRACEQEDDLASAFDAFLRAAELDPLSASAQFDLGRLQLLGRRETVAARHFARVIELAPDSEYADDARAYLKGLPEPQPDVQLAGYDVEDFSRTEIVPNVKPPAERLRSSGPFGLRSLSLDLPPPLSFRLDIGTVYNTNVALAPTSRELFPEFRESFQFFAAPELEYAALDTPGWRIGPTLKGHFSLNEGSFRELNLQSYRPGLFVEHLIPLASVILVPRLAYEFTHDEFAGETFGTRHALSLSNTVFWSNADETVFYWVGDQTRFADDGDLPTLSSRDGWTNTVGLSHRVYPGYRWLDSVAGGTELQRADTDGSNFTYNGFGLLADAEIPLLPTLSMIVDAGWTYRDYPDAQLEPSRNEHIWHAGARLRKQWTEHWSTALVATWDRFDSDNEFFAADRTIVGAVMSLLY